MALDEILGQEQALHLLRRMLVTPALAHAYVFHGPNGTGKKRAAIAFAKALNCTVASADACDTCSSCHKIATGNHPDLILQGPEGNAMRIDSIRTLQRRLSYKPYESRHTVIILDGCELLTLPAANALLKTLEEPPDGALILLLVDNKDALPLTILSRCQHIPFRPLAPARVQAILEQHGMDPATAKIAATLSEGRLDTFAQGDVADALEQRRTAYKLLQDVAHGQGATLFNQARQLAGKRPQCEGFLRWLGLFCRDLVMVKAVAAPALYNHDLHAELVPLANGLSIACLLDAYELIEQLRTSLTMNGNPQLIFEHLLIQLQQSFHPAAALE